MANPRKFSEKIALQNQKQAEETAAFEKIMREVSEATSKSDEMAMLQMKLGPIPNLPLNDGSNYKDNGGGQSPHPNPPSSPNLRESRGRSVGVGPMRRPADRKIDTSPYNSGNTAYLSPPSDTSWRRVSSDSAIHQSLVQDDGHHNHHHNHHASHSPLTRSPTSHRRMTNSHSPSNTTSNKNFSNEQRNHNSIGTPDGRPRSSCGLPRLPGIHIYPSPHENSIQQIPIGNNTGSLPDLTSVHFPSPLHTPIDQEYDHSNSPFSSSPVTASPLTLSPTIPARYPNNTKFNYSPTHSPGDNSNAYSPTHSQHGGQNLSSPLDNSYQQQQQQQQTSQTGSPSSPHSFINTTHSNQHNQTGYQQQNRHHSPPIHSHGSQGNLNNLQQPSLSGYRSPQCRPSPGSSPGLLLQNNGDSNPSAPCSPAPSSLGNNGQNYDYSNGYSLGTLPIQQNFEHFSLVDNPSDFIPHSQNAQPFTDFDNATFTHLNINLGDLGSQNNIGGAGNLNMSNSNLNMSSSNMNMSNSNLCNNTNNSVHGNMNSQQQHQQQQQSHNTSSSPQPSQQQVQQSQQSPSQHRQTPQNLQQQLTNSQTPNTPTSIPEIIFTDFSSSSSEYTKDLFADGKFDLGDLGPMDCVAYQMLSDPNYTIADSRTEDSFREDLDET